MSTLSLKNINKIYPNNVQAVFDFNLDIEDKEFIVFVGPSGCGKSTTLRMVAGLEDITSGELYIDGKLVNNVAPKDRDIAMVFQSYALYPHMTVYDNMAFALKLRKLPMPLYEDNPEVDAINAANAKIWRKIRSLNRKFKKKQDNLKLLEPREKLYSDLYANLDQIASLQKPLMGIDEYKIAKISKTLETINNEINKLEAQRSANQEKLNAAKSNDQAKTLETKIAVIDRGVKERQTEAEKLEKELDFLKNNNVPLTKLRHLTKNEIEVEINKTAASIDLIRYLYRKPAALSGGQRQRVALGRAIVRKPKVFLMDEPLSNLDAKLRVQTRSEISKIHERVGATTIYVTHDQTEAMTMADRIVVMKDGYIQQIGSPDEVYDNPSNKFVAGFIGSPAMNFIYGHYSKGKFRVLDNPNPGETENPVGVKKLVITLGAEAIKTLADYDDKDVILGIRPEALYLSGDKNNTKPGEPIDCECDYSELLGYETILYTYFCGQKVILKTGVKNKVKSGDKMTICMNEKQLYFFDAETEKRI